MTISMRTFTAGGVLKLCLPTDNKHPPQINNPYDHLNYDSVSCYHYPVFHICTYTMGINKYGATWTV